MKVKVKMLLFECTTNINLIELEIPQGARVKELIERIHQENICDNIKGMILDAQNRLKVVILINLKSARLDTILNDNDNIIFLSIISGG